jgi:IS30 family transposase
MMDKSSYKLTEEDVEHICQLLAEQERLKTEWRKVSNPSIADKFGVTTSTIEYIKRNKLRKYAK